jgi:two-component system sensor histidine kinase AlgZ
MADELSLVDRYLAIEQLRLGDRLQVRRELDALPADYPLPRLLLQPLVENAVRHGIQPSREGGEIVLRGYRQDKFLVIDIENPLAATPSEPGNGHGLDNVRQRVAYRYGPRARVEAGASDGRFRVRVQLPETP